MDSSSLFFVLVTFLSLWRLFDFGRSAAKLPAYVYLLPETATGTRDFLGQSLGLPIKSRTLCILALDFRYTSQIIFFGLDRCRCLGGLRQFLHFQSCHLTHVLYYTILSLLAFFLSSALAFSTKKQSTDRNGGYQYAIRYRYTATGCYKSVRLRG